MVFCFFIFLLFLRAMSTVVSWKVRSMMPVFDPSSMRAIAVAVQ